MENAMHNKNKMSCEYLEHVVLNVDPVVQVIHPLLQVSVSNPCLTKRCSHLCVLAPEQMSVCKCPSQLLMDEDGLTCSKPKDSSFILFLSPSAIRQVDGS